MQDVDRIKLKYCEMEFNPTGCTTFWEDGSFLNSIPHYNDHHYHVISHRCGYGDDVLSYCQEHDLSHNIVAESFLSSRSPVLWGVANKRVLEVFSVASEEILSQVLQRFVRAGERPIVGGQDWDALRWRFLELSSLRKA